MRCESIQKRLMGDAELSAEEIRHMNECARCASFRAKLDGWRMGVQARGEGVNPPPGFVGRVISSLPQRHSSFEWAVLRFLPAGVALVLVLSGWCVLRGWTPSAVTGSLNQDEAMTWLLNSEGGAS